MQSNCRREYRGGRSLEVRFRVNDLALWMRRLLLAIGERVDNAAKLNELRQRVETTGKSLRCIKII